MLKESGLSPYDLFLIFIPIHSTAFQKCTSTHMSCNSFLECLINVATRCFSLTDTLQPFADMKVRCIVPFTVHIGLQQTSLGKIEFGCRCNRIRVILSGYVVIEWLVGHNNTFLNFLCIACRPGIHFQCKCIGDFH